MSRKPSAWGVRQNPPDVWVNAFDFEVNADHCVEEFAHRTKVALYTLPASALEWADRLEARARVLRDPDNRDVGAGLAGIVADQTEAQVIDRVVMWLREQGGVTVVG